MCSLSVADITPPPAQPISLRLDNVLPVVNPRHVQLIGPQVTELFLFAVYLLHKIVTALSYPGKKALVVQKWKFWKEKEGNHYLRIFLSLSSVCRKYVLSFCQVRKLKILVSIIFCFPSRYLITQHYIIDDKIANVLLFTLIYFVMRI